MGVREKVKTYFKKNPGIRRFTFKQAIVMCLVSIPYFYLAQLYFLNRDPHVVFYLGVPLLSSLTMYGFGAILKTKQESTNDLFIEPEVEKKKMNIHLKALLVFVASFIFFYYFDDTLGIESEKNVIHTLMISGCLTILVYVMSSEFMQEKK